MSSNTLPIRRLFKVVNGGTPKAEPENWEGDIPWATPVDFGETLTELTSTRRTLTRRGVDRGSTTVPRASILISTRAPIGYVAIAGNEIAFNQGCKALVPVAPVVPKYFAYQAESLRDEMRSRGLGSTFSELSAENLASILVRVPPLEEQRRIADFLDAETSRIDRLLDYRRRQLRLISERGLVLTRVKVSGVEEEPRGLSRVGWLGPTDSKWPITTIGRISRFYMGTTFPHIYQGSREGKYPFIKVGDFGRADENLYIDSAENWIGDSVAEHLGARVIPPGAVLYARVGAALLLNRRLITTRPSIVDDNVRAIVFRVGDPQYWASLLTLLDMGQLTNPGPVPSIGEAQVSAVPIPCPDDQSQSRIARDIKSNRVATGKLLHRLELQLNLLVERRQALITAAVTGQFDVSTASGRNITQGV